MASVKERLRKKALAARLEISRPTLDKYLGIAEAPAADGNGAYSVDDVIEWIGQQAGRQTVGNDGKTGKESLQHWKVEQLRLTCQKLQDQISRDRGEYVSKREAAKTLIPLMSELGELMRQKFILELPSRYRGRDQVECQEMNEKALDEVIRRFREGTSDFAIED